MKNVYTIIDYEIELVEQGLLQSVAANGNHIKEIGRYLFEGKGKRIRPALFLMVTRLHERNLSPYINGAVALELVHTASLLHDDVVDQARIRRGRPTAGERWGNRVAVLAGDFLLSRALQLLLTYRSHPLMEIISGVVGDMAGGEIEQAFAAYDREEMEPEYFKWIAKKTAHFFAGCCQAGSLLGGGDKDEQLTWFQFGFNLGMAFQLVDDIMDYAGPKSATGKTRFGDLQNRVFTLPLIRTVQSAADASALLDLLSSPGKHGEGLEQVARTVLEGDGLAYTMRKAREFCALAGDLLKNKLNLAPENKRWFNNLLQQLLQQYNQDSTNSIN